MVCATERCSLRCRARSSRRRRYNKMGTKRKRPHSGPNIFPNNALFRTTVRLGEKKNIHHQRKGNRGHENRRQQPRFIWFSRRNTRDEKAEDEDDGAGYGTLIFEGASGELRYGNRRNSDRRNDAARCNNVPIPSYAGPIHSAKPTRFKLCNFHRS